MGLFKNFVSQTRKPEGFLGKMMVNGMNGGHAKMADWGMSHLTTIAPEEIESLVPCTIKGYSLHHFNTFLTVHL